MKRAIMRVCAAICLLLVCSAPMSIFYAADKAESRVIKVGMPLQKGLCGQDEDGKLSGCTYDYLQEIAQYTGWEYEFKVIDGSSNEALMDIMEELKTGEIDLLGGMLYDEELAKQLRYSDFNYTTRYEGLYVANSNALVTEVNYVNMSPLRVAVYGSKSKATARLDSFAQENNIAIDKLVCTSVAEQRRMLEEDKADAMWTINIGCPDDVHPVAKAFSKPVYFAFAPSEAQAARELDAAMIKISKHSPQFDSELQNKYFERGDGELYLTPEEKEYAQSCESVKVIVHNNDGPAYYYDKKAQKHKGIAVDILGSITHATGLKFDYITAESESEKNELIQNGDADMLAQAQYNYDKAGAEGYFLSRPYVSSALVMVTKDDMVIEALPTATLALPYGFVTDNIYGSDIAYYSSVQACLDAVSKGKAQYTLCGNYNVQYYMNQRAYSTLSVVPGETRTEDMCFGIAKGADERLLGILNKAICAMPTDQLDKIIYTNTLGGSDNISISAFIAANPIESIMAMALCCAVIVFLTILLLVKSHSAHELKLAKERYMQLSELSGEYVFDYDFIKDRVELSDNVVRDFGTESVIEHYLADKKHMPQPQGMDNMVQEMQTACEICVKAEDGTPIWYRYSCKTIKDKNGKPLHSIGKFVNIGAEKEELEHLIRKLKADEQ